MNTKKKRKSYQTFGLTHPLDVVGVLLWNLVNVALSFLLFGRHRAQVARVTKTSRLSRILRKLVHPLSLTCVELYFRSQEAPQYRGYCVLFGPLVVNLLKNIPQIEQTVMKIGLKSCFYLQ